MSTCVDLTCRATLIPASEWRKLTLAERAERRAQGYGKADSHGLCRRCYKRLERRAASHARAAARPRAKRRPVLVRGIWRWVA